MKTLALIFLSMVLVLSSSESARSGRAIKAELSGLLTISKNFSIAGYLIRTRSAKYSAYGAPSEDHILGIEICPAKGAARALELSAVQAVKNNRVTVLNPEEEYFFIDPNLSSSADQRSLIPVARDLNHDGVVEIVIGHRLNGMHSGSHYDVISLSSGGAPKKIFDKDLPHASFKDVDHDNLFEIQSMDSYRYWNACGADSAYPSVVYAWDGKTFSPSARLMKQPPPSGTVLQEKAREIKASIKSDNSIHQLVQELLSLIYCGNARSAGELLEAVLPGDERLAVVQDASEQLHEVKNVSKVQFWQILLDKIRKVSPAFEAIKSMNPGTFN